MKRLLLTIAFWLAFAVAPGETQRSMTADIPPMVGNESFPNGWTGTSGPCREGQR